MSPFKKEKILSEFAFHASRSGGKGGQHVNKVSTKMEVRFHVLNSSSLSNEEKVMLVRKLKSKMTLEGEIIFTSQATRSQLKNKEIATEKLLELIEKALTPQKIRVKSKPSGAAKEQRLSEKKSLSLKKKLRSGKITDQE